MCTQGFAFTEPTYLYDFQKNRHILVLKRVRQCQNLHFTKGTVRAAYCSLEWKGCRKLSDEVTFELSSKQQAGHANVWKESKQMPKPRGTGRPGVFQVWRGHRDSEGEGTGCSQRVGGTQPDRVCERFGSGVQGKPVEDLKQENGTSDHK